MIDVRCTPDFHLTAPTAFRIRHPENYLRDYERLKELHLLRGSQARCMSLLYEMLDRIAGDNAPNTVAAAAGAYVAEHYADPELCNQTLSQAVGISQVHLVRLFRSAFRTTPKQYILELRLRRARQLLGEGHLTVSQVSELCGFSSVYHFSRAFHQAVGMSPTEYGKMTRRVII